MMKKIIVTVTTAIFLLPVIALAESLTFAVVEWPPVVIVNNDQVRGISVDITREVCRRIGARPEFEVLPLKRAFKYLKEGKVCMASLFHTEERTKFLYYSSKHQYNVVNVIVAPKESGIKMTHLDDLKKKAVGVMNGYSYGEEFDNRKDLKKIQANNLSELIRILKKGRINFAAVEENGFRYMCKQLDIQDKFEVIYTISEKPFYTVFPKKMGEKGAAIAEKFGNTLHQMREEGMIQRILDKYR